MPNVLEEYLNFFHRKLNEFNKQKQACAKVTTVMTKLLLASFKVAYRIDKREKPHSTGKGLVLLLLIQLKQWLVNHIPRNS
jgi:hypothetical protein